MNYLNTFINKDEKLKLEINKSFRSWVMVVSGQAIAFFILLFLIRNQTFILLSLVSIFYIGVCSWILALKKYDKRFITNKKIILLSHRSQDPVKFIFFSQIKSIQEIKHISGVDIKITLYNNVVHHIYDVSYNNDYVSYLDKLIQNVDTQQSHEKLAGHRKYMQGYVYEKLEPEIHMTNITKDTEVDHKEEELINACVQQIIKEETIEKIHKEQLEKQQINNILRRKPTFKKIA